MSKALQNQLIKTFSEKISKECQIQKSSLRDIIKLMFSQKNYFQNFEYLSSGAYALVLKAKNTKQNRTVALKFLISSHKEDKNGIESLKKEYEMLQKFSQSDYLVNVYDCFYLMEEDVEEDEDGNEKTIQTGEKSFFVMEMELCEQNLKQLFDFLRKGQPPSKEIKEIIAIQMLEGLNNLHVKNIMHRDIKPHNYLVCPSDTYGFTIKICDLGFASAVTKSKSFLSKKGTNDYFAPEVEQGQSRIQSDLYSLGLVLLELDNLNELAENWIDSSTKVEMLEGRGIASKYQIDRKSNIYKIAQICLKQDYQQRTTAGDLLSELIKLHGKPLKFALTSMILEEQIPQQAQQIFDKINELQKIMQTQFEDYAKHLLDNTDSKVKDKDATKQFTQVEVLSKLLKSLYEDKKYANNFQILSFGSYGMVLATKKVNFNNKEIVLKIQKIEDDQAIENEINIMKQLREPFVVQLYDSYVIEKATAPERYAVFELEKCSCSLQDYIERQSKDGEFSDEEKLIIAKQVIDCVNYIHLLNIIHRDIKPDNFLVCLEGSQPEIKLCDFGLSAQLVNSESIEILDRIGNYSYMAPEILTKKENENKIYSKKSDSYSVGLILSLLDNYLEFKQKGLSFMNLTFNKFDQPFQNQNINVKDCTEIFAFIKLLFVWDQLKRATVSDIVESNPKKFMSNSQQMKQIKSIISQKSIEDIQKIKVTNMDDLYKISEFQIVEIELGQSLFSENQIGSQGAKELGTEIAQCKIITTLTIDLRWNKIGDAGAKDLGLGIAQCKNITVLTLELSSNQFGDEGAKYLGTGIAQCKNITILSLGLGSNQIGDAGAKDLGTGIAQNKNITTFMLDLGSNKMGLQGAKGLGTGIAQCKNITTLTLDLHSNQISDAGTKDLGTGIAQCKNIITLSLDLGSNQISDAGIKDLSTKIAQFKNISILVLQLYWNKIGDAGTKDLGTGIAQCKNITALTLQLYSNKIGDAGAKDLGTGIAQCKNITNLTLDLGWNKISDIGTKDLGTGIAQSKNITNLTLHLYSNQIGDVGAKDLGTKIALSKNITTLAIQLYSNKIGAQGAKDLGAEIAQCKNITTLALQLQINQSLEQELRDFLKNQLLTTKLSIS